MMDNRSQYATWVDGKRLAERETVNLKDGMILSFGRPDGMTPLLEFRTRCTPLGYYMNLFSPKTDILHALSFRCKVEYCLKPWPRGRWRLMDSPERIKRKERL
jgi:hypothetical protein